MKDHRAIDLIEHYASNEDATFFALRARVDHRGTCWRLFAVKNNRTGPVEITGALYRALLSTGEPGEDFNHMLGRHTASTHPDHWIRLVKVGNIQALDMKKSSDVSWSLMCALKAVTAASTHEIHIHTITLDVQDL